MSFQTVLDDIKTKLKVLQGVKTVKVGLEHNLAPSDFPCVRLVPVGFRKGDNNYGYRICDLLVYFGLPLTEGKTSLEEIFDELFRLEDAIIVQTRRGENYKSVYQKTIVSPQEVAHYNLMAVQLEVSWEL